LGCVSCPGRDAIVYTIVTSSSAKRGYMGHQTIVVDRKDANMAQYTREQLIRISTLSNDIIMATLLIDATDYVGLLREFHNATKYIDEAKREYPQNVLIQNIAAGVDASIQDIQGYTPTQRRTAENTYRARINESVSLLDTDTEAYEFKAALLALAKKVAEAAGHGVFGSGQKVSQDEGEFLEALKRKLGVA